MERFEDQTASFMMICIGDFSSKLIIPTKFARRCRQVVNQVSVMLENDWGKCWDVKMKKMNSDYYMKDGWPKFVKENQIDDTDVLQFRSVGESSFEVSIYRSDGCPRELPRVPSSPSTTTTGGGDGNKRGRGRPPNKRKREREHNVPR